MVTTSCQRTYRCNEVQRASGVGGDRHLQRIVANEVYTIAVRTINRNLNENLCVLQSAVPVSEEPIGTTFVINDLDFTGIGRGVDKRCQENEGDGERASEDHHAKGGQRKEGH